MAQTPLGYTPSPRPTYEGPALVHWIDAKRHIWGDRDSGAVADWIYVSTDKLHVVLFGLAPGKWFKHSAAYRTVFGADEVLYVLRGEMLISNPETGEVVNCKSGQSVFFRKNTWHHVRAEGGEPLRALEFFAPPPSQGMSGAYVATRPYISALRYARNELLGNLACSRSTLTMHLIERRDHVLRLEGEIAIGLVASSEDLTVAELSVPAGTRGIRTSHGGNAMFFPLESELMVSTFSHGQSRTFEVGPYDAVFIPQHTEYEVLSFSGSARALLGVAPGYLP